MSASFSVDGTRYFLLDNPVVILMMWPMSQKIKQRKAKQKNEFRVSKSAVTTFLIVAVVVGVLTVDYFQRANLPIHRAVKFRQQGNTSAKIKIIEYVDFQCHQCAEGYKFLKQYLATHPEAVFVQVKHFPLNQLYSIDSAIYAECAAQQEKFWPLADALFLSQDQWRTHPSAVSYWKTFAQEAGLNMTVLDQCVSGGAARAVVLADREEGARLRIQSTPTYFINGEMFVGPESLRQKLESFDGK